MALGMCVALHKGFLGYPSGHSTNKAFSDLKEMHLFSLMPTKKKHYGTPKWETHIYA